MEMPETQYTRSGDVNIAYQIIGDGPIDLLWIPGFAQHLELAWEEPYRRAWLEQLGAEYRVIVFDKRGTGLSDRVEGAPGIEERMDDCRAVLDAAGSQRAAVLTAGDASDLALVFAATYPERVLALRCAGALPGNLGTGLPVGAAARDSVAWDRRTRANLACLAHPSARGGGTEPRRR